ncbi:glycoside hydrolase family 95 protein [Sphingomonas sp. NPDC019816]|uniref:glycoside hydrolase family 95 protein n=1 Tax=Sphingomonas sp. NPDC019816 TaxID=3390679 RepID=UPI003CFCD62B
MRTSRRGVLQGLAAGAIGGALAEPAGAAATTAPDPTQCLWYRAPAKAWTEALPVGNGRLGAMVFGGIARERLQLNEDSLWAGGPYNPVNPAARAALPEVRRLIAAGRLKEAQALADRTLIGTPRTQMPYQPLGDLILSWPGLTDGAAKDYHRQLDLYTATATTRFTAKGVAHRRTVIASPIDQVLMMRIEADRPFDLDIALSSPQRDVRVEASGDRLTLTGHNADHAGVEAALRFAAQLSIVTRGGTVTAGEALAVRGARSVTLFLAMATSRRGLGDLAGDPRATVAQTIDRARSRGPARIAADALAEHRRLYRRVALDLGTSPQGARPTDERVRADRAVDDPALATLYFNYGRYLLIAASRAGGQPANLQGLWNESIDPPWGSKYTVNINTEMNYWPAEPTGLGECVAPLVQMVRELAVSGERTAREMYGARGWVCHHNTDLWRATAPIDGAPWGMWPTGGAWLCTHLWEHYDYHRDPAFLASVYPLMRGVALFFVDTLQSDPKTGRLVTSPSVSPENEHSPGVSICAGPAMDQQILRDLFDQVARAATILNIDADFAAQVRATRARLAPDRIGRDGQLQEWQEDWDAHAPDPHHRHVSHLYALFPSDQITPDGTPELARAARHSLETRGDQSTGWATAWRANLWARLHDGEHAHRIIAYLLGPQRTYPNLFDSHPPFQIDGNFGGTRAVVEMLMQSRGDELLLLPALPRAWPTGSVSGLHARGRCRVDLRWRDGRLVSAMLTGDLAGERLVRLGDRRAQVTLVPGRPIRLREADFA